MFFSGGVEIPIGEVRADGAASSHDDVSHRAQVTTKITRQIEVKKNGKKKGGRSMRKKLDGKDRSPRDGTIIVRIYVGFLAVRV